MRVCPEYKLAVDAVLIEATAGMRVMRRLPSAPTTEPAAAPTTVTALSPPQPNPFNPQTQIRFSLGEPGSVELVIYDLRGQKVRTLVDGEMPAGPHAVDWAGTDQQGRGVSSGLYLLRMKAGGLQLTQKLQLLR